MKKINLSLILLFFFDFLEAQNPLVKQWDYRFGGTSNELFTSFQQTQDQGYILGGYSYSGISGDKTVPLWNNSNDYWIVKIDSAGNKQWDKDFGGNNSDALFSIKQTNDKGFILSGLSQSNISGNKTQNSWGGQDYWIVKTDSLGNFLWDRDFGGPLTEFMYSIQQTTDNGYILGGFSYSGIGGDKSQAGWGSSDFWIVKTDSSGNKQWDKDFGGNNFDELNTLLQTYDGGYILGGHSQSNVSGNKTQNSWGGKDYWIVKTDSFGNFQWDKDFGGTGEEILYSIIQTSDMGYLLGGVSGSGISGDKTQDTNGAYDYWIVKIDSLGNKQWDKDFGGDLTEENIGNISQTYDGGFLLAGTSYSNISGDKSENNLGQEQTWIVKTDSLGNKQWDKTIFSTGHDEIGLAVQTKDQCYAIVTESSGGVGGYKTQPSWGGVYNDYWIVKFCDTTLITSIPQFSDYSLSYSIYPNPVQNILTINLNKNKKIIIINLLGEVMMEKIISSGSNRTVDLDISFLSEGIYFIKVDNEAKKFVKK